jgi:lactoylglutathione lyase
MYVVPTSITWVLQMEGKIGLVTVLTDDIASMKIFYSDVLGFEVIEDLGSYVEFRSEGVRFAVCTREVMFEATSQESYKEGRRGQAFELAFRGYARRRRQGVRGDSG